MASPETSADRYIGLMSGTSLDGADAVLVDFSAGMPSFFTRAGDFYFRWNGICPRLPACRDAAENWLAISAI